MEDRSSKLRTPLRKARGLGSAKDGTGHWWAQRVTAIALVPLSIWFVISVIAHISAPYGAFVAWAGSPVAGGLLILLIAATFYHGVLGLQVVIEDYVHDEGVKIASLLALKFAGIILALAGILAVLTLMV